MEKINIDFQIYDSNDPKYIIVLDTSSWGHIVNKPAIIEVTPPGFSEPWVQYFDKNSVNYISSSSIGLNCYECDGGNADLPDGVYKITVKGSPDKFCHTRNYLKTTNIDSKLDEILMNEYSGCEDCTGTNDNIEKVLMYKNLLEVANASVRRGNHAKAQEILDKVRKYTSKFKTCKKCPHNQ